MTVPRAIDATHALAVLAFFALGALLAARSAPHLVESATALHGARLAAGEKLYQDPRDGGTAFMYPPGFYVPIAGVERVHRVDPVVAGRAVSLIALAAAALATVVAAWRAGNVTPGLGAAAVLLAGCHAGEGYAFSARVDALAGTFALAASLAFFEGRERGRVRLAATGVVLGVLAVFTKQVYVWLIPFLLGTLAGARRAWIPGLLALAVVLGAVLCAVVSSVAGEHFFFYAWVMPASHSRSPAMLLFNARSAWGLVALVVGLAGAIAATEERRLGSLGDPRFLLAVAALVASAATAAKVGARANSFLPALFLVVPWLLAGKSVFERAGLAILLLAVGLWAGAANALRAHDTGRARRQWMADVDSLLASSNLRDARILFTDPLAHWERSHEGTPLLLESTLDVLEKEPRAFDGFVGRVLDARYDAIVISRTWEYREGYGHFEAALARSGYDARGFIPGTPPRDGSPDGRTPETTLFVRRGR